MRMQDEWRGFSERSRPPLPAGSMRTEAVERHGNAICVYGYFLSGFTTGLPNVYLSLPRPIKAYITLAHIIFNHITPIISLYGHGTPEPGNFDLKIF